MKRLFKFRLYVMLALVSLDGIFFTATDPTKIASAWLIVGFGLLFVTGYFIWNGLLALLNMYGLSFGKRRRASLFASAAAVGLTAFQSIGELTLRDILLALLLTGGLYWYFSYGKARQEKA